MKHTWLPEVLPPAPSAVTQIDDAVRRRWMNAESLRRAYRRKTDSTTNSDAKEDTAYDRVDRAFRVACMEVTLWRDLRQGYDEPSSVTKPGALPVRYQEFLDLALRDSKYVRDVFLEPAGITDDKSKRIAAKCQLWWRPRYQAVLPARIRELAKALRSGYPAMGTIEKHMRCGVFVLFNAYVGRFAGDTRFASDAGEAAGLLVDACLSFVETFFQQRAGTLKGNSPDREAKERDADPSVGNVVGQVGGRVMVCRHCGKDDPVGQVGEVGKGVDAGRDALAVLGKSEKDAEPWEEMDGWERDINDEEQESGWSMIH